MQIGTVLQSVERLDGAPGYRFGERQAGQMQLAVDQHRAGAATTLAAAEFGGHVADDFAQQFQAAQNNLAIANGISVAQLLLPTTKLTVKGGSDVLLGGYDTNNIAIANTATTARGNDVNDQVGHALTVPDVAPYPEAYNGQFLQLDVMQVTTKP